MDDVSVNPATEYVEASRESSGIHAYVADHGDGVPRSAIEHVTLAGREVAIATSVTAEERAVIEECIRAVNPVSNSCFENALRMWDHSSRFQYVEGFAVRNDLDVGGIEHAWCLLDGAILVDATTPFDHYHGVQITAAETLEQYLTEYPEHGILGNHKDRFGFLREQGYTD